MPTYSFRRILELFEEHDVERNVDRVGAALTALNARYREHHDLRPTRNDLAAGGPLLLMTDSGPFDVLGFISRGKRYEDVAGTAVTLSVGDLAIKVLPLSALIEEKKTLGRAKDLAVVELLEGVLARQRR